MFSAAVISVLREASEPDESIVVPVMLSFFLCLLIDLRRVYAITADGVVESGY